MMSQSIPINLLNLILLTVALGLFSTSLSSSVCGVGTSIIAQRGGSWKPAVLKAVLSDGRYRVEWLDDPNLCKDASTELYTDNTSCLGCSVNCYRTPTSVKVNSGMSLVTNEEWCVDPGSGSSGEGSSDDGDSGSTIIIVVIVGSLLFLCVIYTAYSSMKKANDVNDGAASAPRRGLSRGMTFSWQKSEKNTTGNNNYGNAGNIGGGDIYQTSTTPSNLGKGSMTIAKSPRSTNAVNMADPTSEGYSSNRNTGTALDAARSPRGGGGGGRETAYGGDGGRQSKPGGGNRNSLNLPEGRMTQASGQSPRGTQGRIPGASPRGTVPMRSPRGGDASMPMRSPRGGGDASMPMRSPRGGGDASMPMRSPRGGDASMPMRSPRGGGDASMPMRSPRGFGNGK